MLTGTFSEYRDSLYTDIKLNETLCGQYQTHMGRYDRSIIKSSDKVLTASSDIGLFHQSTHNMLSDKLI